MRQWRQEHRKLCREYNRKYRVTHLEKVRDSNSRWQKSNPEKNRVKSRRWRATHLEEARRRDRERRASDPKKYNDMTRDWRRRNPEKALSSVRNWQKNNLEKVADISRASRSRRRAAGKITSVMIDALKTANIDAHGCLKCDYCGDAIQTGPNSWHIDHIRAVTKGGANSLTNLRVACPACNMSKHDKDVDRWQWEKFLQEGARYL